MNSFNIFFENSPFWLIPAFLLAGLFAYILYRKASIFSDPIKKTLGVLRFFLLFILFILLITPVIKQVINYYEDPVLVLALDNSTSITASADSTEIINKINFLAEELGDQYRIELSAMNGEADEIENVSFKALSTDLHALLNSISNDYENRNLAAVIIMSDGIYNQGINPVYTQYSYPIYSLGIGDTTSYSDIGINQLRYNKLSYQGNKMPIQVEVAYEGLEGENATVSLIHKGETIASKSRMLDRKKGLFTELFLVDAMEQGMQRYEISIDIPADEKNKTNNIKTAFIDIVEGKKNILLISPFPHPDIKALRSAIEENQNYEFIQYIPTLSQNVQDVLNLPVDLVIMHQLPQSSMSNDPVYRKFLGNEYSKWWITGPGIDYQTFNEVNNTVKVKQVVGQTDNITAWYNPDFTSFTLSEEIRAVFNALPPVAVPFGDFEVNPASNIFLKQQVGNVKTQKPLFITSSANDIREGVFLGDGLWRWKLYEYAQHQSHVRFNELISKTVQYISSREDKRKFRFYPVKNEFNEGEQVIFESEVYNELYEPVYGQQISIVISGDEGTVRNYQYVTSESNSRYPISGLPPGIYSYNAKTNFNNTPMSITGEFAVNALDLENIRLTANFDLLKELSTSTGGSFHTLADQSALVSELKNTPFKQRIQSTEDFLPLINITLVGIILLLLACGEWITRKYYGSY